MLAIVNVAAVLGAIYQLELEHRRWDNQVEVLHIPIVEAAESPQMSDDQIVSFEIDPCHGVDVNPVVAEPAAFGNLPAELVSGWGGVCPPSWSIASKLGARRLWFVKPLDRALEWKLNAWMLFLVAVQWLVLGSLPTLPHKRWWLDPGAFITICTAAGVILVAIPSLIDLGRFAGICAFFTWPVWFVRAVIFAVGRIRDRRRPKASLASS